MRVAGPIRFAMVVASLSASPTVAKKQPGRGAQDRAVAFANEARQRSVRLVPAFPPGAVAGGSYMISAAEQKLYIQRFHLPKNFTLTVAPDVAGLDFAVDRLEIEDGATIDLSGSQAKPATPPSRPPAVDHQAGKCDHGAGGATGIYGTDGVNGRNLVMTVSDVAQGIGSLWIKSDGGPGGDGGRGGDGQQGGGPNGDPFHQCSAGGGGDGGSGGLPGGGGRPGYISIYVIQTKQNVTPNYSATCGPQQRPTGAAPGSGVIVSFSARGCDGQRGPRGTTAPSG